jgi:hypothetical protein
MGVLRLILTVVIAGGCGLACQKSSAPPPSRDASLSVNGKPVSPTGGPPQSIDEALKSDPCAAQLHDISGAMLLHLAVKGRLPATLDELRAFEEFDRPLNFTCPATGAAYTYVPTGLASPDDKRQIVLHDAGADRSGVRWAILMQRPQGRQPAAMFVLPLTEPQFRAYTAPPATRPAGK